MAASAKDLQDLYRGVVTGAPKSKGRDEMAQFVEQRFYAMSYVKQPIREVWQGIEDLYYCNDWEWIVKGEGFDRPVRFPTLRDFIKSLVDVFMKDPPDIVLDPMKYDASNIDNLMIGKQAYIDERRNSIHEKTVRRQVVEDMFFFGKGIREVGYYDINKSFGGENYNLFNDVATSRIDPRDWFVDETAVKLHDKLEQIWARDVIRRRIMPVSTFRQMFLGRPGFRDVDKVQGENWFQTKGMDYVVTNSRETVEKSPVWIVKAYEYMNQEQDIYAIVANGVTVFQDSLKKVKGTYCIPASDYTFEPRNDSYWGNPLGQLIAPHIYLKDTIFNLELKNLQLTLQPVMAMSGDFGYNPAVHFLAPGQVWTAGSQLNGKLSDNITPLVAGNPNTKSWEMLQDINSELSITARTDLRTLEYYKDKTATETIAQNKSMNAHNETIACIAEIESEAVLFEIFLQIMEEFMDEKGVDGNRRRIKIQDYAVSNRADQTKFVKKAGMEDYFELTEEMIDAKASIQVLDKRSQIAADVEKMGRIMQILPILGQMMQLSPEAAQKTDIVGLMQQAIEAIGMDLKRSFKDDEDIYDDFEATKDEILLGNEVTVPTDEDRKESLARFKYFTEFAVEWGDELRPNQTKVLYKHIDDTLKNVKKNHLEMKRQQYEEPQGQQPQGTPPMGQAQAQQDMNEDKQRMSQPDTALLGIGGPGGKQLM